MKVVLLEDVKSLGKKGEVVEVSPGYAKNFILPKKLGAEATSENLNTLKLQKANKERVAAEQLAEAKNLRDELLKKSITVSIKGGNEGRTYGSVTSKEIATAIAEQLGIAIDKRKLVLAEAIKTFGTHEVAVKLHKDVMGKIAVKVIEE